MLVAHITDPHLGLDTRALPGHPGPAQALRNALRHVQSVDPVPEVLLLTGDLTESGAEADFRTLRQVLDETLPSPQAGGPLVLAVLGSSGALAVWAPLQPVLALAALAIAARACWWASSGERTGRRGPHKSDFGGGQGAPVKSGAIRSTGAADRVYPAGRPRAAADR